MKIQTLPIYEDGFQVNAVDFCGIDSYLITPAVMGAKWTKQNLIFRSLIVRGSDFEVLSSGFPKFFNFGEKPDMYPSLDSYKDWYLNKKHDGTLMIVDYVNDTFSMRTRGTVTYKTQPNYEDFEEIYIQHPKVEEFIKENSNFSLLFELETPNNIIVIPSADIKFTFLGAFDKNTGKMVDVKEFMSMADKMEVSVPETYSFSKDLVKIVDEVKGWVGSEGIVLSYNNFQNRVKIKADDYLVKHRMKSELNSEQNFVELYVHEGMPDYQTFFEIVEKIVDYETAVAFQGKISKVVEAGKEVSRIVKGMKDFVQSIRNFPNRKEQALAILSSYGGENNNRSGMVFAILDNKELDKDQIIKLFWQVMKK